MKAFFTDPAFRYSGAFESLALTCAYTPKEQMLHDALWYAHCNQIEGEYLEFGVGTGQTFVAAYHFLRYLAQRPDASASTRRRCVGFDSFQGLPPLQGLDAEPPVTFKTGQFAASQDSVRALLTRSHVPLNEIRFVSGWFSESLTPSTKSQLALTKAAVCWIDCDLYESTATVLPFITDLLQPGSVLILDDWFTFRGSSQRGEQRALAEWKSDRPDFSLHEFQRYGWQGISFIVEMTTPTNPTPNGVTLSSKIPHR